MQKFNECCNSLLSWFFEKHNEGASAGVTAQFQKTEAGLRFADTEFRLAARTLYDNGLIDGQVIDQNPYGYPDLARVSHRGISCMTVWNGDVSRYLTS